MLLTQRSNRQAQKPLASRLPRGSFRPRSGYALLACLLTIAISSSIVVAIFNVQRVHCAEAAARRQLAELASLQLAAQEHALAVLIDQPTFRGQLGPFTHPAFVGRSYSFQIVNRTAGPQTAASIGNGGASDIQVISLATVSGKTANATINFTQAAIDARRSRLGL